MRAEAGYNMVVLIVAITVLNILVAAMLPLWSTQIRREKEEELIFRGFQYAEAIRVFHNRFQRYPTKLEELLVVKHRSIRQLWKDPMTEDGKWGLIFKDQPQELRRQDGGKRGGGQTGQKDDPPDGDDADGRPQFGPAKGDTVEVGEIVGVRSKSREKSFIVLFGRERYDEWAFTEEVLLGGQRAVGQSPGNLQFSTRWLGRPDRFSNQSPAVQDGTMPDGKPAGPKGRSPKP